ncbi:MAG: ABC transporter ATP-binding protein [Anaerolineales bacterium]
MSNPILEFDQVTFGYSNHQAAVVQDLTFKLRRGKITAILGSNGAGKTTLLHLALGILHPWNGAIYLNGKDLHAYTRREIGKQIALVPQMEQMVFEYTVLDFILMGRAPHLPTLGQPGEEDVHSAFRSLQRVGIADLWDHSLNALSGGERQLVLIARALTQDPQILFLDEPTAHLDLHNSAHLVQLFRQLRNEGVTLVITSHDPQIVFAMADDALLLQDGRVVAFGTVDAILDETRLGELYQLDIHIHHLNGKKLVEWL